MVEIGLDLLVLHIRVSGAPNGARGVASLAPLHSGCLLRYVDNLKYYVRLVLAVDL